MVKEVRMTVLMHLLAHCSHAASSTHDCSDQTKDAPRVRVCVAGVGDA